MSLQLNSLKQLEKDLNRNYEACYLQYWEQLKNDTLDRLAKILVESEKSPIDPEIRFWQLRAELSFLQKS